MIMYVRIFILFMLGFDNSFLSNVISLIKIPDVLIKVHLFTLFIPINIVDSGASR